MTPRVSHIPTATTSCYMQPGSDRRWKCRTVDSAHGRSMTQGSKALPTVLGKPAQVSDILRVGHRGHF